MWNFGANSGMLHAGYGSEKRELPIMRYKALHRADEDTMTNETSDTGKLEQWTAEQVYKAFKDRKIVLIDVRTPQEFAFEHIEGALLAPLATFKPENLPTQDGKRIVFHCGSGMRSSKVAAACEAAGMTPIAHLEGGFAAWKKAALPYVTTDPATGSLSHVEGTHFDLY